MVGFAELALRDSGVVLCVGLGIRFAVTGRIKKGEVLPRECGAVQHEQFQNVRETKRFAQRFAVMLVKSMGDGLQRIAVEGRFVVKTVERHDAIV